MNSIILEGVNGAGKSTLAGKLSEIFDLKLYHPGSKPDRYEDSVYNCVNQFDFINHGDTVLDRITPISAMCYDFNLPEKYTNLYKAYLDLMADKAIIIYCTQTGIPTNKPYYPDGHIKEIMDNQDRIKSRYDNLMKTLNHITYDYKVDTIEDVIERIYEYEIRG